MTQLVEQRIRNAKVVEFDSYYRHHFNFPRRPHSSINTLIYNDFNVF